MKLISFFSRFTFICNICFILFVIFSITESSKPNSGVAGTVNTLPFFKDLVIILGFSAILINLVMCIIYVMLLAFKKIIVFPKWLSIANFCFLIPEFYFFFFYK
jgi:hypothetical protein